MGTGRGIAAHARALLLSTTVVVGQAGPAYLPLAQQPLAQIGIELTGVVRDARGAAVPTATVVVVRAPAYAAQLGGADVQQLATDAAGHFAVQLQAGAAYRAFATAGDRTSELADVMAGAACELRLGELPAPRSVELPGLAAWMARAPFQVQFAIDDARDVATTMPVRGERVDLPPLPAHGVDARLLDRVGLLLCVLHDVAAAPSHAIAPPIALRVRAVDARGAPLAGVLVQQFLRPNHRSSAIGLRSAGEFVPRATTGADGLAVVEVPKLNDGPGGPARSRELVLIATGDGRAATACSVTATERRDGQPEDVLFTLPAQSGWRGIVRAGGAARPERVMALLELMVPCQPRGDTLLVLPWSATVASDGAFALPAWSGNAAVVGVAARLGAAEPVAVPVHIDAAAPRADVDFATAAAVALEVIGADGHPVTGAWIHAASKRERGFAIDDATACGRTDARGRLPLQLPAGSWFVYALTDSGVACASIDKVADQPLPLRLTLQPLATMRVRAVDIDGNPVAGATLSVEHMSLSLGRGAAEDARAEVAAAIARWAINAAVTDAEGRADVRHLAGEPLAMTFRVQGQVGGRLRRSAEAELSAGERVVQAVLQ